MTVFFAMAVCCLKRLFRQLLFAVLAFSAAPSHADMSDEKLSQAQQCLAITNNLQRLSCYDQLFSSTERLVTVTRDQAVEPFVAPAWWRAVDSEAGRENRSGFIYQQSSSASGNHWLTALAIDTVKPSPILMLSCIDNISRVELVLQQPLKQSRFNIQISNQNQSISQQWLANDSGKIIRSGRGLPAISAIKAMLYSSWFTIEANMPDSPKLMFSSDNLKQLIKPLRQSCGW